MSHESHATSRSNVGMVFHAVHHTCTCRRGGSTSIIRRSRSCGSCSIICSAVLWIVVACHGDVDVDDVEGLYVVCTVSYDSDRLLHIIKNTV